MMSAMETDSKYRNLFETKVSGGNKNTAVRDKWERKLFGNAYHGFGVSNTDRPKYGVLNLFNDPQGIAGCRQYGDSYIVLKYARLRCTLSPQDSANLPARRLAVLDHYAHAMMEFSDTEIRELINVARGGLAGHVGDSESVLERWGRYKEAQIHCDVRFDRDVESLVVAQRHWHDKA